MSRTDRDRAVPASIAPAASRRRFSLSRWPLTAAGALVLLFGVAPVGEWLGGVPGRWAPTAWEWMRGTVFVVGAAVILANVAGAWIDRAIDGAVRFVSRPSPRVFGWLVAATTFAICAVLAWYCFAGQGTTGDEMSMRFQARLLASGRLFAVPETYREFFNTPEALDANGRWFSQFPVGWPLVLAPAMAIGAEWIVGPLCTAFAVLLFHRFLSRVTSDVTARFASILLALSPWLLFLGSSQQNHIGVVLLAIAALGALARWASSEDAQTIHRAAAVLGLTVAGAATIRPYDAALIALPIGVFQLASMRASQSRTRWQSLAVQLAAGAIPLAVLFYANARTTGHPLAFAYDVLNGPQHRPGFHMGPQGFVHSPLVGLVQTSGSFLRLSTGLFEWPIPAVAVAALGMMVVRTPSRWDYLLAGLLIVVSLGYMAYWSESYFVRSPRFLIVAIPALVWFVTRAVAELASRSGATGRRAVLLVLPLATLAAWRPTMRPFRDSGVFLRASAVHAASGKEKLDVDALIRDHGISNAVVFVNETFRARLLGRLRVLGVRPHDAGQVVDQVDACELQRALDEEDVFQPGGRPIERVLTKAMAAGRATPIAGADVSFADSARHDNACLTELKRNAQGTMPFAMFLSRARFDDAGRLDGPVVFAIDYGARNELLRARFGNRAWYRLRVEARGAETTFSLVPY
jgi:hypothetical protein